MESHQASKLDVSGTAKAVISCFQKLGAKFDEEQVVFLLKSTLFLLLFMHHWEASIIVKYRCPEGVADMSWLGTFFWVVHTRHQLLL